MKRRVEWWEDQPKAAPRIGEFAYWFWS